jgi:hypothetical protein
VSYAKKSVGNKKQIKLWYNQDVPPVIRRASVVKQGLEQITKFMGFRSREATTRLTRGYCSRYPKGQLFGKFDMINVKIHVK